MEFWNITNEQINKKKNENGKFKKDFIDNPEVPPLE